MENVGGGAEARIIPRRLDLYLIRWRFRACTDYRPCIIIDAPLGITVKIMLVSAAVELRRPAFDFLIRADHPDFKNSGLSKDSYALGDEIHAVEVSFLGKHLGCLQGQLAREYDSWIGE